MNTQNDSLNRAVESVLSAHAERIADAIRERGVSCRVESGSIIMGADAMTREYGDGQSPSQPFLMQSITSAGAKFQ